MRILYVDDNIRDADLVRRELARHTPDYQVETATTLQQARDLLAQGTPYDLVLLDLRLPDGSGMELLAEIREQALPLAIVILTGSGDEEAAVAALKAGADDYLVKRRDYLAQLPRALDAALNHFRIESARIARPLRVLYAEHNAADIDLTRRHLARHAPHIHLEAVYTASEVLQRIPTTSSEPCPYDVLLFDYRLPQANALDLLKTIRQERGLDLPVVLVTGQGDADVAVQAWRLGATDYLVKHAGYLFKLPVILENAFHQVKLTREQATLRASEEKYRLIVETAQEGIWIFDGKNKITFANNRMATMLGYSVDEMLGQPWLAFMDSDSRLLAESYIEQLQQNLCEQHEFTLLHKDGTRLWVVFSATPLFDHQGRYCGAQAMVTDISDLKQSQNAEREQRMFAEVLADTASALIGATSVEAVMHTILANAVRVVPHAAANIMLIEGDLARPLYWKGYPSEYAPAIEATRIPVETHNIKQMMETGKAFLVSFTDQYTDWINLPQTTWVKSYVAAPIRSKDQVIGFLNLDSNVPGFFNEMHAQRLQIFANQASIAVERATLIDQVRHHAAELEQRVKERTDQLRQSLRRTEAILNNTDDIIVLCHPEGTINQVNPAFNRTFSCQPDKALFQPLTTFVLHEHAPLLEQAFQQVTATLKPYRLEITVHYRNHASFDADVVLSPIMDEKNQLSGIVCSFRDITQRKQMEARLRQMLEHEIEIGELKSRYISMAAHDLRNPLAVIQTAIGLLQKYGDRLTAEKRDEKFRHIRANIKVMADMLDDILTLGKAESGKLKFEPEPLNIIAFCNDLLEDMQQAATSAHPIEFNSQGDCHIALLDPRLLRHILSNLLSNAIKYSPLNSPVTLNIDCKPNQIILQVQDQGIGIPKEDQKHLFETFHRASNTKQIPGTGLGLAIVKQSVELHGGTITFESEEGHGTTFTITIPQVHQEGKP